MADLKKIPLEDLIKKGKVLIFEDHFAEQNESSDYNHTGV